MSNMFCFDDASRSGKVTVGTIGGNNYAIDYFQDFRVDLSKWDPSVKLDPDSVNAAQEEYHRSLERLLGAKFD